VRSIFFAAAAFAVASAAIAAEPMPTLTGNTAIHDPSVIATDTGWASFATGVEGASDGGMPRTKTSPDGVAWTESGAIPGGLPAWIAKELGYTPRNIWAPSVTQHNGVTYLYYSASSFGRNDSAIGLMTNAAFDPTHPADGWTDKGMVLRSHRTDNFSAIDPFRVNTSDGKAWLAFGSFWDGIRLVELDPETGMRKDDTPPLRIASRNGGPIEAPAILEHDGKFYLFVSFDLCCRGISSTYRIMVGRADAVTGPYIDRDGKPMTEGGGTELVKTTGRYHGPGGQEVFLVKGLPWLAFHYYNADLGGVPLLLLAPIGWTADGWPELGPLPGQ
jgi:arabinan endo-1,5-alpha-L-arabinosidase